MNDLGKLRLQDFDAFAAFGDIAERTGTEIVLHGGTAFRALLHAAYRDDLNIDLFDLAPFNSDIDLDHDGTADKSAEILTAINTDVRFASWFRWSINDRERARLAKMQRAFSTDVPLRRIRLSTRREADIPQQAVRDIAERRVSFTRNPGFGSATADARPDIELYGLMMALNTWTEMQEIVGPDIAFDRRTALQWLRSGLDSASVEHAENVKLAARFWHLLSARLARAGRDSFSEALIKIGRPLLDRLGVSVEALDESSCAISISRITASSGFRVPELTPTVLTGPDARRGFEAIMARHLDRIGLARDILPDNLTDLIDPSLEIVAVVPELTINPYGSASEAEAGDDDPFYSGMEQEFVQIAWDNPLGQQLDPLGLTGQLLVLGASDLGASTALPVVGGTFGPERAWVRARLDDLVERGDNASSEEAALIILQARAPDVSDAMPRPHERIHEQWDPADLIAPEPDSQSAEWEWATTTNTNDEVEIQWVPSGD